jgi:hypothetical protein
MRETPSLSDGVKSLKFLPMLSRVAINSQIGVCDEIV